ncbi:helix-turn-helix domain-containing protein [Minwuia thermotolerans]|uniref:AraC family transcriptional regulator n=1 Tax=Minwuia thermotolerans TaxID=2056226 RepID=A0A2M9FZX9_9PROT|nr:AraC family transcriptional regulator [Minwuia thermotolerans]PJK28984.1 AraC family transcriptional regulator [Minwuia thermotolerans]
MKIAAGPVIGPIEDFGVPGAFEALEMRPGAVITHLALRYQGYSETVSSLSVDRMPAALFFPVIVNFGSRFVIHPADEDAAARAHDSFAAGLIDRFTTVRFQERAACMQADFSPFGARAFFGRPLHELTGQVAALEDVIGPSARELEDRLRAARDWPARFRLLDGFVRDRLARAEAPRGEVVHAWRLICESAGGVRIGDVAREVGWSRRHLIQTFHEAVGHRPKTVAGILRFQHALRLAHRNGFDWAATAYDAGYADQAHLVRSFGRFAGLSPTAYVRSNSFNMRQPEVGMLDGTQSNGGPS